MSFSACYYKYIFGPNIIGCNANSADYCNYITFKTLLPNRNEILYILLLPLHTSCFLLLSKGLSSEGMIKWPDILGDFCFLPFPSRTDGSRERAALEAGFSGRM